MTDAAIWIELNAEKNKAKRKGDSMNIVTRLFGEVGVDIKKVINFQSGIIGFENYKQFMIIHDAEVPDAKVVWLQSIDEPDLAIPIMNPLTVKEDYNPIVEDELFKNIGEMDEKDGEMLVFVTLTVPTDITKMTVNLKAPIIINPITLKGCQIVVDNEDYLVRYPIYDILKKEGE